ncbi:MAG: PaaI family thioesterase [Candidatus Marinimicrobia bacterium]|nr:PaaI family thioesterase [Candidatus Neomarinimicrobiota bacterium]
MNKTQNKIDNEKNSHFIALENMYIAAPINTFYRPRIRISDAEASIEIDVSENLFHSADAVHGSVYFKMLDDDAFFAANSLEKEYFVLTTSFTTYLTRPISSGIIRSEGRVVNRNKSQIIVEAIAYNSEDKEIGRGNGIFICGKLPLKDARGYIQ